MTIGPGRATDGRPTITVTTIVLEAARHRLIVANPPARLRPIVAYPLARLPRIDASAMIALHHPTDMDEVVAVVAVVTITTHDPPSTNAKPHHRHTLVDRTNAIRLMVAEKATADTRLSTKMLDQDGASRGLNLTVPILASDGSLHLSLTPITSTLRLSQDSMLCLMAAIVVDSETIMDIAPDRKQLGRTSCMPNRVLPQYAQVRAAMSQCMSPLLLKTIGI